MQAILQLDAAIFRGMGQYWPSGYLFDIPAHRNALFGLCGKTIHFYLVKKARNKFHETVPCLHNGVLN